MERRDRKPVFFSDRSTWIPIGNFSYPEDFPITKRSIRDALTDNEMLPDHADRVLSNANEKMLKQVREELRKEST